MPFKSVRPIVVAVVVAAAATACSKSPTGPSTGGSNGGSTATVTSVEITGSLSVSEGGTSQLTATAKMSNGTSQNVTSQATWRSSDTSVATVSGTGLVTSIKPGNTDITAVYSSQTGRKTLQVTVAQYRVTVATQSVTALGTCDDFTQGLTNGEFTVRVLAITSTGAQTTLDETPSYPGNPDNLRVYNLGESESQTIPESQSYTLQGASGQFVRVQFNATEWDSQIVIFPPSTRWIHDDSMNDRSASRSHSFGNGGFSSLGPNTLTIGNSSCGIRLNYTVTADKQ